MKPRPPRQAVDRPATIFVGGSDVLPARIRDISTSGANLQIADSHSVVRGFDLHDVFSAVTRKVAVVWRGPAGIGVRFVDNADWPPPPRPAGFGRRWATRPSSLQLGLVATQYERAFTQAELRRLRSGD